MDEIKASAADQRAAELGALVIRAMDPATAAVELARIERRHRLRQTMYGAVVLALALVGLIALTQTSPRPPHMALADGTTVQALSDDLDVVVRETQTATLFELKAGRARFDVAQRDLRPVRVVAGAIVVDVLGTRFDVLRAPEAVTVHVRAGQVRVRTPGGQFKLAAGATSVYPTPSGGARTGGSNRAAPAPIAAAPTTVLAAAVSGGPVSTAPAPIAAAPVSVASVVPRAPAPTARTPRSPARKRRSVGFDRPKRAGARDAAQIDGAESLFQAADVARRAGDTKAALAHLENLLLRHPRAPKAPLAAFTRGRLLTTPGLAAQAFERAFELAPFGPLAVDALARAALARQAAGQLERAKAHARTALRRAPNGRRAAQLRAILTQ